MAGKKKYNSIGEEIKQHNYKFPEPLFQDYKKLADTNKRSVNAQLEVNMAEAIEASKRPTKKQ